MKFEVNNPSQQPVAVLSDDTLRFQNAKGDYFAVRFDENLSSAWESDKKSFDDSIAEGGRVFYPGDTLTIRF